MAARNSYYLSYYCIVYSIFKYSSESADSRPTFILLDWAKVVSDCTNVSMKQSSEGRIKLLVTELKHNFGVLV